MKERIIDPQFDPDREKKIFKMYVSIPEEEEERLTAKEKVGHLRFEWNHWEQNAPIRILVNDSM